MKSSQFYDNKNILNNDSRGFQTSQINDTDSIAYDTIV